MKFHGLQETHAGDIFEECHRAFLMPQNVGKREFQLRGLCAPQSLAWISRADHAAVGSMPLVRGPTRMAAEMGRLCRALTFMLLTVLYGRASPMSHMES